MIDARTERLGLRLPAGRDYDLINTDNDPRYHATGVPTTGDRAAGRHAGSARKIVRRRPTLIAALMMLAAARPTR